MHRYMHGRGCTKRNTVGCTDDLPAVVSDPLDVPLAHSPAPSSGRTRRTGLLTVTERPPGEKHKHKIISRDKRNKNEKVSNSRQSKSR